MNRRPVTRTRSLANRAAPLLPLNPVQVIGMRRGGPADTQTPVADERELLEAAIDWARYVEGRRVEGEEFADAIRRARAGKGFIWLGLHEPTTTQLAQLGELFELHELALEDASNSRQRPKIEKYDDALFLAMRTLAFVDRDERTVLDGGEIVETGAVMVFVGEYFAVTVRHGRHAAMGNLRNRLEANADHLALGPSAVLHAICDKVVDDYLAVVDQVTEDIEEIESSIFSQPRITNVERIYQLKRDIIETKRTVGPLASPLHELSNRSLRLVHPDIREYFRDAADHLDRVREQVQGYDELLGSILQAGLARLTVSENEDMRKISAWVAIAAVPTMIAGIYGMNFTHMPALNTSWGFPALLVVTLIICALMHRGFRHNGWL